MKNALEKALPIVARSVSEKYDGLEVIVGGNRASTQGTRILIPDLPETREARLLARGYIDHEAAHVRHTNFRVDNDDLTNALEDIRIESILSREFPGARKNLKDLAEHYVSSEKIGVSGNDSDQNILGKYAHFKLRQEKLGHDVSGILQAAEKELVRRFGRGMKKKTDRILGNKMRTTEDCKRKAGRLYELLREREQEVGQDEGESGSGPDNGTTEGSENDPGSSSNPDNETNEPDSGSELGTESGTFDNESSSVSGEGSEDSADSGAGSDNKSEEPSGSSADFRGIGEEVKKDLNLLSRAAGGGHNPGSSGKNRMLTPVNGEKPDYNPPFAAFKRGIAETRRVSAKMRRKLQGILETRRRDDERISRQGGRFAKKDLHRLALKDTRVFTRKQDRDAPDTAIHFLLDTSGSMSDEFGRVLDAGYALALALEGMQHVAYAVTSYPCDFGNSKYNDDYGNSFYLEEIKRFGDPLRIDGFNVIPHGTTPTDGAMWYAAYTLAYRKESRKMIFVITDGEPDDVNAVRNLEKRLVNAGIEVFGLGIDMPRVRHVFGDAVNVSDISELAGSLFKTLQRKL